MTAGMEKAKSKVEDHGYSREEEVFLTIIGVNVESIVIETKKWQRDDSASLVYIFSPNPSGINPEGLFYILNLIVDREVLNHKT